MLFIQPVQPVSFSLYRPASVYTGYAQAPAAAIPMPCPLITASLFIPVRTGSTQSASHLQADWLALLVLRLQKAPESVLSICLLHIYPCHYCQNSPLFLVMAAGHFAAADESCPGHTYTWQYLAKATSPPTPCCNEGLAGNAFSHMPVMSDCAIAGQLPAACLQFSDLPWCSYHCRSLPMVHAWWAGLLSIRHKRYATRCRWPYCYLSSEILTMRYMTTAAPADRHKSGKEHCAPGNWAKHGAMVIRRSTMPWRLD